MKTAIHGIAAATAIVAAQCAFAANTYYWNGKENASFPQKANWENSSGTAPSAHVNGQTEDNLWFQENKYNEKFTGTNNRTVKFSTVVTNTWKVFIRDNGTESAPLVFDLNGNVSASCGLVAGVSTSSGTGFGFNIGDGGAGTEAWLKLAGGTYRTAKNGVWSIGNNNTANGVGHIVSCEGVTMSAEKNFEFRNGTLDATGTTLSCATFLAGCATGGGGTVAVTKDGGTWTIGTLKIATNRNVSATFEQKAGTLAVTGNAEVGDFGAGNTGTALFDISGGTVTPSGNIHLGYSGAAGASSTMKVRGTAAVTLPDNRAIFLGNASAGRLEISESAVVQVGNYVAFGWQSTGDKSLDAGEDSALVLSGSGVLKTASIRAKATNGGTATITFDGGTLKVLDNANTYTTASGNPFIPAVSMLSVNVTENGGTIDTSGLGITIAEDMAGAGPMAFTGGGTVTLSAAQTGSGDLTVAAGTTLKLGSGVALSRGAVSLASGAALSFDSLSTNTAAITASSFAFASDTNNIAIPSSLEQGEYKLFTLSEGEFAADAADNIQVQCAVPHSIVVRGDTIYLSIIGHHYIVVYGTTKVSPALQEDSHIIGAGGFNIANLALPAGAKLTYDPVKTPIYVWTQLTVNEGFKFALSENYSGTTCGRIVLLTFKESGVTGLPGTAEGLNALFDASTIAPGAQYAVTVEPAPANDNVGRKQLVLTVGDYANAPEIRILPIGDSITQGVTRDDQGDYPQYRTSIAARLAASGYRPKMKGVWKFACYNAAHVEEPDDWVWHCGISGDRIRTARHSDSDQRGGVRDNLHLYLDAAGYMDVITLLIGTNDVGGGDEEATVAYANYKPLVIDMAAKRPAAKIVIATLLQRNGEDDVKYQRVVAFNNLLKADFAAGNVYPANVVLLDLFEQIPLDGEGNFFSDKLHMNWAGCSLAAEAFAGKIMETLPLPAFTGTTDPTVTAVAQTAQGAAQTVPAEYRDGMTHVFTIDAANAGNAFGTQGYAPYTETNTIVSLSRQVTKVGYYMELVRAGTSRRRYVWVDFDATGKTLEQIDFPWTGDNIQFIAEKLHVYSNDSGISNVAANVDSVKGIIEGTYHSYTAPSALSGAPDDILTFGWNDTLGSGNAGFGCFQAHRIFSQAAGDTHWNDAQVLFAWNRWGASAATDEIGIGDYACHASGVGNTMDYTHTVNKGSDGLPDTVGAGAYQVRHLEIWAVPVIPENPVHGKWIGGAGPDMSNPYNWDDNTVPVAGEALDFGGVTSATTVNADIGAAFGAVTMGTGVVTFNGSLSAKSFTDTSKVAVGENATVTVRGDVTFTGSATQQIVNRVAAGGTFAVDGSIILVGSNYLLPFADNTSEGVISARGLVDSSTNSDAAPFRIGVGNLSNDYGKGGNWLIGSNGLTGSKGFWLQPHSNDVTTVKASADFNILMPIGVYTPASLNLDTADGHTITVRGDGGFYRNGTVRIKGSGKVVCDFDVADISGAQASQLACPYSVEDAATLAVKPGSNLGNGAVSVGSGATLALTAAGTVTLNGGLSAAAGATIVFPFDGAADTTLQIAAGATLALPGEGGKVKIATAAGSKFVSGKKYTLVFGANLQAGDLSKFELPEGADGELSIDDGNLMYRPTAGSFIIKIGGTEVPIPADWLKGIDYSDVAELRAAMIGTGANGLPRWQSYCLGLDPANAGSVLTCVPGEGPAQTGKVNIAANVNVPEGLWETAQITAYLDRRKTDGTWEIIETKGSALSGKVAFAAPAPEAALDFFRVRVAIGATASAE